MFRNKQKIFMGYSDVTFLHLALYSQAGWTTFHGPNFVPDPPGGTGFLQGALAALRGEEEFAWDLRDAHVIRHGTSRGPLIGGNLTCLVHLLGTPFFPDPQGAILLIEDRGEALYRLDRLLTHLCLAGVLDRLGGMVLGNFDGCGDLSAIWEMVAERVRPFRFPVVANLPFGHGCENRVVPLGIPFHLNTRAGAFKAERSPFQQ
jgi:muramoyltetrapeptide carboxypeptidase